MWLHSENPDRLLFFAYFHFYEVNWTKLRIEEIIENVENSGGEIDIMSTENIAGEQLVNLGSIIGILRYKL